MVAVGGVHAQRQVHHVVLRPPVSQLRGDRHDGLQPLELEGPVVVPRDARGVFLPPPPIEFSGTFIGDYTGLAAWDDAYPIWADTRQVDLFLCPGGGPPTTCAATEPNGLDANDEEIFTDSADVR